MQSDLQFETRDAETGSGVVVIVRRVKSGIALCVAREDDGDVEVVLQEQDFSRLVETMLEGRARS